MREKSDRGMVEEIVIIRQPERETERERERERERARSHW